MNISETKRVNTNDIFKTANIILAGITGAGKSTLINAVFGKDFAATGKGRPVTQEIKEYQNDSIPVRIWDSIGFEIGSDNNGVSKTKESITKIKKTIEEQASKDQADHIHAIWYCINQGGNRYQSTEAEFVKELHTIGVPFIIIVTQCIEEDDDFVNEINKLNRQNNITDIPVIEVLAQDKKLRGGKSIPAFGLDKLVDKTLEMLPSFIKGSFIAGQQIKVVLKREECEDIISNYEDQALKGFWDRVPLINLGVANVRFKQMVKEIFAVYNQILSESAYDDCVSEVTKMLKQDQFSWFFTPDLFNKKNKQKLDNLMESIRQKGAEGLSLDVNDYEKSTRTARTIVFYGYTLLLSIEDVWRLIRKNKIEDLEREVIPRIQQRIRYYLNGKQHRN